MDVLKNILSGERVKDIDIFFESESDFQEAIDSFNDEKHQKEGWKFKYRNEKVCAFQKEGEKVWIEFIESEFGKPKEILRSFDFTVTKMAYYKEPKYEEKEDDYFPFSSASIVAYEYKLLYHEKFFEHLHMKRLVIDENIPFPVSTWERSYRYKGYGYNMCRETKKNAYQCRFVVSSGQLFFVDDEYAGTVKLTNLDNGESNISFPSCDDGLIINPADKHIK